jgi:hypothetical protein
VSNRSFLETGMSRACSRGSLGTTGDLVAHWPWMSEMSFVRARFSRGCLLFRQWMDGEAIVGQPCSREVVLDSAQCDTAASHKAATSRLAVHLHGITYLVQPSFSFGVIFFVAAGFFAKFAMYSAYDTSILRIASARASVQSMGSCSQSGLLSCVWSPRYRGEVVGQPKSLTR